MANQQQLIKEVANELQWTQAAVRRAIDASGSTVSSKEDVYACLLRYAGPEIKKLVAQLGAQRAVNTKQRNLISQLVDQLSAVQNFYASQLVPTLKAQISEQAGYIKELLEQVPNTLSK